MEQRYGGRRSGNLAGNSCTYCGGSGMTVVWFGCSYNLIQQLLGSCLHIVYLSASFITSSHHPIFYVHHSSPTVIISLLKHVFSLVILQLYISCVLCCFCQNRLNLILVQVTLYCSLSLAKLLQKACSFTYDKHRKEDVFVLLQILFFIYNV